jgi:hypothetical protein
MGLPAKQRDGFYSLNLVSALKAFFILSAVSVFDAITLS